MSLIAGLTMEQAQRAVADAAARQLDGNSAPVGLWCEVGRERVMVGIARRGVAACTVLVDKSEWDGIKFLELVDKGLAAELRRPMPRDLAAVPPPKKKGRR